MKVTFCLSENSFFQAFLSGLTAIERVYPSECAPVRYPRSHKDDLNAIGADMWRAFEKEAREKEKQAQTA